MPWGETMASSSSSWRGWQPAFALSQTEGEDEDGESFDYSSVDRKTAGDELVNMIVDLKLRGTLSAKQAVTLAFWCAKAGAEGGVQQVDMNGRDICRSGTGGI